MKKLLISIVNFFKTFWKTTDQKVIIPMTKAFLYLYDKSRDNGKIIETWLNKRNTLIFLSLIVSLVFFIFIDTKTTSLTETTAEILYNQEVTVIYNKEAYVIEGLPKVVDITLIGSKSDIYLAKQIPTHSVTVDLTDLKPGTHTVSLRYTQPISSLSYKLDPSSVTIVIREKVSLEMDLEVDLLNSKKLDSKLIIDNVETSIASVYVKGSEQKVSEVAIVKALIDVNQLSLPHVGKNTIENVKLLAYNNLGEIVDVEIVPEKVDATITITSPSKEVPIKIIPEGTLTFGSAISLMTGNITKIIIYGTEQDLENIEYVPVKIDVNELNYLTNSTKKYTLSIKKPKGVKSLSSSTITINVNIDKSTTKTIEDIYIESQNLGSGLKANAVGQNKVPISLTGVASVLENIDTTTIKAYVNLEGLGVGTHTVNVLVSGNDLRVEYASKITSVEIKITNN